MVGSIRCIFCIALLANRLIWPVLEATFATCLPWTCSEDNTIMIRTVRISIFFFLFSSVFFCFLRFSLLQPEELLLQLLWLFSVFFGDHLSPFSCRLDLGTRLDHRTFTLRKNSHGFLASRNSSHDFLAHFPFITDRIIDGIFSVDHNGNFHSLLLIHWGEDSFIFSVGSQYVRHNSFNSLFSSERLLFLEWSIGG